MKIYIAGPVTGHKDHNRPLFEDVRYALLAAGYEVIIPHDHVPSTASHDEAMAICLPIVAQVDGIALLDLWWQSFGTITEMSRAWNHGIPFKPWEEWL